MRQIGSWPSPDVAFARPKSRTFTTPSGVILIFAGFRSRWTMPFSCAASSASAIWRAMASASVERHRPARDSIGQRLALDEFEDQRGHAVGLFEPVDRADVRMIERCQDPRLAFEPRESIGIARKEARQDLDRHVAAELRVARAIDLAHAARAQQACSWYTPIRRPSIDDPAWSPISCAATARAGAARNP